jgi:glycosyltransferase involved in cell wall biosynthesis
MKLLYVTDAFAVLGGMERVLADKMYYLAGHLGYEVVLLTVNQGEHTQAFPLHPLIKHVDLDVRMHQQYAFHGIKRYFIHRQLVTQLKDKLKQAFLQINADVIVCAKLDFVGVLNEVRSSVPLVVESHTLCKADCYEEIGVLRRLHVWEYKRQVKHADAVVTLTAGDAEDWQAYNRNVFVIPNVVHLNETSNYSSCTEKKIVFVGRFTKQKDFVSLLHIWSIVFSRHSDWTLDIYTDGKVEAPGIRVFKPVANIMEKYIDSSILLLTSLFEPFGLVIPEAMSCGLPVVSFDCPYGPADIITDGVDGFLIKNRDIQAFADRVCQLIEDKELRVRMGQAAIKSSQRYRADVIMPKWKELFESLFRKE